MPDSLYEIIAEDARAVCDRLDLRELAGKSLLLTGASGILGVYFAATMAELIRRGAGPARVIAVMQSEPEGYLQKLLADRVFEIFRGDITDGEFLKTLPGSEYVIHAAGYGQPGRFMANQVKTLQLNTSATFVLFERLARDGKFLFLSTSEVYSGLALQPHRETDIGLSNTTHPRSCYIEGKRCGEAICNAYRSQGVAAKSARLALAYGPGTRKGDRRVLNSLIEKGLAGKIALLDQGEATRTYGYVADAVEILWHILLRGKEPIYNVGGTSRITVADLARRIGEKLGAPVIFPAKTEEMPGAPADVQLDLSKVAAEFGKTEFVLLETGLDRTIAWQRTLYNS